MVLNGGINAVFHVGDMAYDMYENNGTTGDQFMQDITAMAANTPYMVGMGNHESAYNFSIIHKDFVVNHYHYHLTILMYHKQYGHNP